MLTTNWPRGADLPRARKRRKRPPSKTTQEARRIALATSQVVRKLTSGRTYDPTIPAPIEAQHKLECCAGCGGPLIPSEQDQAILAIRIGKWADPTPVDGRCVKCAHDKDTHNEPSVRVVGVGSARAGYSTQQNGKLLGEYRPLVCPAEGNVHHKAGHKLSRMARGTDATPSTWREYPQKKF